MERKLAGILQAAQSGSIGVATAASHVAALRKRNAEEWTEIVFETLRRGLVCPPNSAEADQLIDTIAAACAVAEGDHSEEAAEDFVGPISQLLEVSACELEDELLGSMQG
jgi:hypothetical protein